MPKIIEITIKDPPICEFETIEELKRYVETHKEETAESSWYEVLKNGT
jgi:hypothetical protein